LGIDLGVRPALSGAQAVAACATGLKSMFGLTSLLKVTGERAAMDRVTALVALAHLKPWLELPAQSALLD